jgi:Lysozyme like domain
VATFDHLQLEELWTNAGGPTADSDTAAAVAQAESGGNSTAIDNTEYPNRPGYHAPPAGALPEFSVGLWQINLLAHPSYTEAQMLDPIQNAKAALEISSGGLNFNAWSTYTSGAYLSHLTGTEGTQQTTPPAPSSGASSAGPFAPSAHGGWHSVNVALSRTIPYRLGLGATVRKQAEHNLARKAHRH